MGNSLGDEEEQRLEEGEKTLGLEGISPEDVYSAFQSFLAANSMLDSDFQTFAQTHNIPITVRTEFYDALKASVHHYKPKLALMAFTLYSNATPEAKAGVMYKAYCEEGPADPEKIRKLVYNLIDVSVNVSRRIFASDIKIRDYAQNLRKGRELLLSSLNSDITETPVSRDVFIRVMTSGPHISLLRPAGVRRRLQELINANTSRLKNLPVIPTPAR